MKASTKLVVACLTSALLTACGGINGLSSSTPLSVAPQIGPFGGQPAPLRTHSKTFRYTGAQQTFKVPTGVKRLTASVSGAVGSHGYYASGSDGGGVGGLVTATIPVMPGETIAEFVGGAGATYGKGGFNGGGSSGFPGYYGGGGISLILLIVIILLLLRVI